MPLLKPEKLLPGHTIGIVAPASRPNHPSALQHGVKSLEALGFQVKIAPHVLNRYGFLAGRDEDRLADLHAMFADDAVQGIICLRGGYGTARLLPQINFDLIASNPKVFVGYSDITALNNAFHQKTGLITFWGPMVASEMSPVFDSYSRDALLSAISSDEPLGNIGHPDSLAPLQTFHNGKASGRLIGGTLSLLTSVIGSPYDIDYADRILFFEEVGEEPHRIDRMLTQLLLSGKLEKVRGIAIGECPGCESAPYRPAFPYGNFSIEEIFADRLGTLGIPVVYGFAIGHGDHKATLPIGVQATLDADAKQLIITESGVQ